MFNSDVQTVFSFYLKNVLFLFVEIFVKSKLA